MIPCPSIDPSPSGRTIVIRGIGADLHLSPEAARLMAARLVKLAERLEALMPSPAESRGSTTTR